MKKVLALFLALTMLLALVACKGEKQGSIDSSGTVATEFKAPESYATVLLVTINPEFKLYLDENNEVLAVEPVNSDASSIAKNIEKIKGNLETVVRDIVSATEQGGFIKNNATVTFKITMVKDSSIKTDDILNTAKNATNEAISKSEKTITITTLVAEDALKDEISSDEESNSSSQSTSSQNTSSKNTSSKNVSSANTSSAKPQNTTSIPQAHVHTFSPATCTEPAKCSCGVTDGKVPQGHKYSNGTCTVCGAKDPNFVSYTTVNTKKGSWSMKFLSGKTFYSVGMTIYVSADKMSFGYGIGEDVDNFPIEMREWLESEPDLCETFEGKKYYIGMGDSRSVSSVKEDGTTVTITDEDGAKLVLTRTAENTMAVKSADDGFAGIKAPVGAVLTFIAE